MKTAIYHQRLTITLTVVTISAAQSQDGTAQELKTIALIVFQFAETKEEWALRDVKLMTQQAPFASIVKAFFLVIIVQEVVLVRWTLVICVETGLKTLEKLVILL